MFLRKDMLHVIFELLPANSAYHVIGSWFGLLNAFGVLLILCLFALHVGYVITVFLIQKLCILLGKFSLFLELKDRCTIRCFKIEGR